MVDWQKHPYAVVSEIIDSNKANRIRFSLARYALDPETCTYRRKVTWVDASSFLIETVELLSSMDINEELALQSATIVNGRMMHIPMIDFENPDLQTCVNSCARVLSAEELSRYIFFRSGRSYHAYQARLISRNCWLSHMGKLLLVNARGSEPVVDTRWIGHRLASGAAALRWTCNSGRYLVEPFRVDVNKP